MSFTDPSIGDYYDQYENECEISEIKSKKTKFTKWKVWFNDIVRLQIISFVIIRE